MEPTTWQDRALALSARFGAKPALAAPLPWSVWRSAVQIAVRDTARPGLHVEWGRIGSREARIATPRDPVETVLWCHGGCFTLGSPRTHARLTDPMAAAGLRFVVPNYRLAPEHPFPAGYEDCLAAAREIAAQGPFLLGGDSAGGTLAASVLAQLLADGTPPLRVALIAPAADLDPARPDPTGARDLVLSRPLLERIARDYVAGANPADPRLSPLRADYPGCPPVLIHCSHGEILEEDCDRLADRMRDGGGQVTVEKAAGLPHAWHIAAGRAPAADAALAQMAAFLKGDA
ncbi:alpha/beta hydrolase [Jannaschia aquimarina]|nr:alpha/beta hydrolase [Jannaschia aquimarina]